MSPSRQEHLASLERKPLPASLREPTPGATQERILFFNSIGGLGDTIPVPLVMKLYRSIHPDDRLILYDSMFFSHYFEPLPWIDEIYPAATHLMPTYAVGLIASMDATLPKSGGVALRQIPFTRIVNLFRAHGREVKPEEIVIDIDYHRALNEVLFDDFDSYELRLKKEHQAAVDHIVRVLRKDGRPLIAIQNRAGDPYRNAQLRGGAYSAAIAEIAHRVVDMFGARVLMCGDVKIPSDVRYKRGDWFDLDSIANIYYKLDILRQADLVIGAPSGFSLLTNLLRSQSQRPVIFSFCGMDGLQGGMFRRAYPDYDTLGGFFSLGFNITVFRDPKMIELISNDNQTPQDVIEMAAYYMNSWR